LRYQEVGCALRTGRPCLVATSVDNSLSMQFWLADSAIYMKDVQLPKQPSIIDIHDISGHPEVCAKAVAVKGLGISKAVSICTRCSSNSRKAILSSKLKATEAALLTCLLLCCCSDSRSLWLSHQCWEARAKVLCFSQS